MAKTKTEGRWKSAKHVADMFDISSRTVCDLCYRTDYPLDGFRTLPGGKMLVDPAMFDDFLKAHTIRNRTARAIRT